MTDKELPFQKVKRTVLVKKEAETDPKYGGDPNNRSMDVLIDYGIINIDKPRGPTSHQVSDYLKRIIQVNKAGHSGTLDPNVTGVLPTATGRGTRVVEALLKAGKEYVGIMHLHHEVDEKELRQVLVEFTGKIKQLPPIKSAVKRQERFRKIYYFDIIEYKNQDVLFKVGCQAGTYIRKLCLHPSTEIICEDGMIPADRFYNGANKIFTKRNGRLLTRFPSETQSFHYSGDMVSITMSSGMSFTVTPDHRMLVSHEQGYIMKQARDLKESDFIVKSIRYPLPRIDPAIADLLDDSYLVSQKSVKASVKERFVKRYGSIRSMYRQLKLDRKSFLSGSDMAIPISHIKKAGIYDKLKGSIYEFKTEKGIHINCKGLNSDMMYLIGLIASDGNNTKEKGTKRHTRIKFHNKEEELIQIFESKYKGIFPNFNLSRSVLRNGVIQLDSSNSFFATICANLGVKSPYKESDLLPILHLPDKYIQSFLRGYLDGDGTAYYKKKENTKGTYSKIDIFTVSKVNAKRLHQMLLKLKITSTVFSKKDISVVSVNDISSKNRFISLIGSNHPLKRRRFKLIKDMPHADSLDNLYIGLHYKDEILTNKSKLTKLGGNVHRIINSDSPITRRFYKQASKLVKLPVLDDFCIEKIKEIKKMSYSGRVYDMTVPESHNFLIETGFVSSNCHDVGKRLKVGANMSELRRTKAGPFNESTAVSLQDVADALWYYKNEGKETYLRSLIQPIEKAVEHLPKIWVFDTTVDTMCHGADLKVPGISKVESDIQVDDKVAILTLKNELIALGTAKMISSEIIKNEKGLAVITEKVFMIPGTYPKVQMRKV